MSKEEEEKEEFSHIEEGEREQEQVMGGDMFTFLCGHRGTDRHTDIQTHTCALDMKTEVSLCEHMLGAGRELLEEQKENKRRRRGNKHKQSTLIFCVKTMSDLSFCVLTCYFLINKQSRVENKAVSR